MKTKPTARLLLRIPKPKPIQFELVRPEARAVFLAGTFNDWHSTVCPMIAADNGKWMKELALPPGRYEYLFVADGIWVTDPNACEATPNPHGGTNSVLVVPLKPV